MSPARFRGDSSIAKAPFMLVPQFFGSIVFDRSTSRYLPFDVDATALLVQLRNKPFSEVLADISDGHVRDQAVGFFEHFHQLGFFSVDGLFVGSVLDVSPPAGHLVGPLAVHLEVTASCNLKCTHCFAGDLPRKEQALTLDELDRLFATLAGMGSYRLGLTGGEPLLRRDIFDIVDLATEHGLHPCLTTNGLLITEQIAREFGKRDLVWLNVSVEGATARTNDLIRGEGTFDRVMERIELLSRHTRFTLAFTILRSNLAEIETCVALAERVGAHTAVFRPLYPVGVAGRHLDLMPTFAEYTRALDKVAGLEVDRNFDLHAIDPFSPRSRADHQAVTSGDWGCGAGTQVCSVSLGGDVNPCSFLGGKYVAANLHTEDFERIWNEGWSFREMREHEVGNSPQEDSFSGGCRARALVLNGSVHAPDPWLTGQPGSLGSPARHPLTLLRVVRQKDGC